jgi:UDP-N-acetyl-D-glucosamine dehydrogenase
MSDVKNKKLVVIGQGYVGLPLAMEAVKAGWRVIGIDSSSSKINLLNSGKSPVEDVSDDVLKNALANGRYIPSSDFSLAEDADVVTICVPTPLNKNREPDLSALRDATISVAKFLKNGSLLISESTSFPGTLREEVIPLVNKHRDNGINEVLFAGAPERVNPGDLKWTQKNTPRLVGGIDSQSQEAALNFYHSICDEVVSVDSPEIAEAAKLLENTFRLVNIALINEFAKICDKANININKVIDAAATKPYGFMEFRPGVGVGGHCIPVDPLYLTWWARNFNFNASIVELSDLTNREMHKFVAEKALRLTNKSNKIKKILILGISYKAGIADVRETPAEHLFNHLKESGFEVEWMDSLVESWNGTKPATDVSNFDLAIVAVNQTSHPILSLIKHGIPVLDCTNSYNNVEEVFTL